MFGCLKCYRCWKCGPTAPPKPDSLPLTRTAKHGKTKSGTLNGQTSQHVHQKPLITRTFLLADSFRDASPHRRIYFWIKLSKLSSWLLFIHPSTTHLLIMSPAPPPRQRDMPHQLATGRASKQPLPWTIFMVGPCWSGAVFLDVPKKSENTTSPNGRWTHLRDTPCQHAATPGSLASCDRPPGRHTNMKTLDRHRAREEIPLHCKQGLSIYDKKVGGSHTRFYSHNSRGANPQVVHNHRGVL